MLQQADPHSTFIPQEVLLHFGLRLLSNINAKEKKNKIKITKKSIRMKIILNELICISLEII